MVRSSIGVEKHPRMINRQKFCRGERFSAPTLLGALAFFLLSTPTYGAQADWKKDWEQTLAAARKEGQVTVYIYRYEGLLRDFKREFPGINVVAVTGRGNELTNRIMAERRAGRYIADVYSGGTNSLYNTLYKGKALDPLKPLLILPEVTDLSKWYGKEHRYADPENKFIFAFIGSPSNAQLAYNTNLVNPKEFKSYADVINPTAPPNAPKIKAAFRVRKTADGRPIVTDMQVEGIWLALSQRSDFTGFLQQHGGKLPALTDNLKTQTDQVREGGNGAGAKKS